MTFLSISESLRLLLVPGLASPFCTQIERIPVTRAKLNLDGATLTLTPRARNKAAVRDDRSTDTQKRSKIGPHLRVRLEYEIETHIRECTR